MKRIMWVLMVFVLLVPVFAAADDGTYFDYDGMVTISVDVKTSAVAIGDPVEFTIHIKNTTNYKFEVTSIWIFGYIRWEAVEYFEVSPGQTADVAVNMTMPEPNHWYQEDGKFYQPLGISVDAWSDDPYISIYYENQDLGRIEITNLKDGTGIVRMDILEEESVCAYTIDKYGDAYLPIRHYATVAVTNLATSDIVYLDDDENDAVLKQNQSYIFSLGSSEIYKKKNDLRSSVMVDYPFIFRMDGKYFAYKESRIYPAVNWDYDLDLSVKIEKYAGAYKSQKAGYENYAVKITNTGDRTIDGFYAAIGDTHHDVFSLANLVGRLDPGETAQYYITHPSNEPELNIYAGIVYNDSVYYTNKITCTNMDTGADAFEEDSWATYNENYPDMVLTITDDVEETEKPQDFSSTEAYDGPAVLNIVEADEPDEDEPTQSTPKPENVLPNPTQTPITVTVEKTSVIPAWVYVVLPLTAALVVGLTLFLRKKQTKKEDQTQAPQ